MERDRERLVHDGVTDPCRQGRPFGEARGVGLLEYVHHLTLFACRLDGEQSPVEGHPHILGILRAKDDADEQSIGRRRREILGQNLRQLRQLGSGLGIGCQDNAQCLRIEASHSHVLQTLEQSSVPIRLQDFLESDPGGRHDALKQRDLVSMVDRLELHRDNGVCVLVGGPVALHLQAQAASIRDSYFGVIERGAQVVREQVLLVAGVADHDAAVTGVELVVGERNDREHQGKPCWVERLEDR